MSLPFFHRFILTGVEDYENVKNEKNMEKANTEITNYVVKITRKLIVCVLTKNPVPKFLTS